VPKKEAIYRFGKLVEFAFESKDSVVIKLLADLVS
jgi:hypothetical protein